MGENADIPVGNAPSILNKNYTITAEVTIPEGRAKHYRWEGGVGADDWLGKGPEPGNHTIVFDFKFDRPGFGKGGTDVFRWTAR